MNAINFMKQHGIKKAKKVVEDAPEWAFGYDFMDDDYFNGAHIQEGYSIDECDGCVCVDDLKRLVESVGLVEQFGNDIVGAKRLLAFTKNCKTIELSGSVITTERLKQAVADYEAIYGGEHV